MIDKKFIGREYPETIFEVEKVKIREFARAIGDNNPIYYDEKAAEEAGFSGLAAPPTFGITLEVGVWLFDILAELKVDLKKLLHGSQEYEYFQPVQSGDKITGKSVITDIFEKTGKRGIMDFVVLETTYTNQHGQKALHEKCIFVVQR